MKLNLECGLDIRSGWINVSLSVIDVSKLPENAKFVVGNFSNLTPLVDDESVDEILFNPFLNVIDAESMVRLLKHWSDKLKVDGILNLKFFDIRRIGRGVHTGDLTLENTHNMIHGQNMEYRTLLDCEIFKKIAKLINMSIDTIVPSEYFVTIQLKKHAKN